MTTLIFMDIPENILQAVADAAFENTKDRYCGALAYRSNEPSWESEDDARRAIIQHALDNQALAPFLAGGIGEYTNEELLDASNKVDRMRFTGFDWLRAFLAALPRRESPALVSGPWSVSYNNDDNGAFSEWWDVESTTGSYRAFSEESAQRLCDILNAKQSQPLAEAAPPAAPEPAAQVPLGPEDVPPGSIVTNSADSWYKVKYVIAGGIRIDIQGSNLLDYEELKTDGWSINTSLPDTGRWDANAWRPCSKPGKEVAK